MFYDPRISMGMMFTLIGTILTASAYPRAPD